MEERLEKMEEDNSETSSEIASTWNSSHEDLLCAIADRSNCYRWLHNKCQTHFEYFNFYLTIPSVAISTLAGSATIGLQSLFKEGQREAAATVIGLMTLGVGVLTSVNQFMKTSQNSEAHRIAAIAYGKLHRVIASELTLRRDQRLNALDFLKVVRTEQDRLQETCPNILDCVITKFNVQFKDRVELEKPEIVGDLDHVVPNRSVRSDLVIATSSNSSSSGSNSSPFPKKMSMPHMDKKISSMNDMLALSRKVPFIPKNEKSIDSHCFQLEPIVPGTVEIKE
jgi:hypothetical protein